MPLSSDAPLVALLDIDTYSWVSVRLDAKKGL